MLAPLSQVAWPRGLEAQLNSPNSDTTIACFWVLGKQLARSVPTFSQIYNGGT